VAVRDRLQARLRHGWNLLQFHRKAPAAAGSILPQGYKERFSLPMGAASKPPADRLLPLCLRTYAGHALLPHPPRPAEQLAAGCSVMSMPRHWTCRVFLFVADCSACAMAAVC